MAVIRAVTAIVRRHPIAALLALACFVAIAVAKLAAAGTDGPDTVEFEKISGAQSTPHLVVIFHGAFDGPNGMTQVTAAVQELFPVADILLPKHAVAPFSNADPRRIASAVEDEISRQVTANTYERVTLVGYSMGSLIARQAYLYGVGGELAAGRVVAGIPAPESDWVRKVDRIVLLAGMNRGWAITRDERNARQLRMDRRINMWLGKWLGRISGTGRMILEAERGAPFVADLRANWLRLMRGHAGAAIVARAPLVVQLLGSDDDIVSDVDNADVGATPGFYFIPVEQTNHSNVLHFDGLRGAARKEKLRLALLADTGELTRYRSRGIETFPNVKHAIFVMHGIRDYADWTKVLETAVEGRDGLADTLRVERPRYDRLPMLPFLVYAVRERHARWFMDKYTEALAKYPSARISYIGHSNGTYMLGKAVEDYRAMRFQNVLLAGSVLPMGYDWDRVLNAPAQTRQVQVIANVTSTGDWVVAIFPHFFETIAGILPGQAGGALDLGAAGFRGFRQPSYNIGYTVGAHSAAIDVADPAKVEAITSFTLSGNKAYLKTFEERTTPNRFIGTLSQFSWAVWAAIVAGLVWFYRFTAARVHGGEKLDASVTGRFIQRRYPLIFTALLLLVLYSI